jgi:hypothetical protein
MATLMLVSFSLIFIHCFSFATKFSYTIRQSKDSSLPYNTSLHTLSIRFIAEYTYIYLHINNVDTTGRVGRWLLGSGVLLKAVQVNLTEGQQRVGVHKNTNTLTRKEEKNGDASTL